ncbi:LuxR C-terminal-related transcriptional regulator [Streptomyces pimonensis]|uniref:LuxR C-terminal-related transcriptional regulator n=1 Tax=Streptomyces pimonensis TaxID=2860288 RepID=A0ABV4J721_9ACTN
MPDSARLWPLVGRDAELAAFDSALATPRFRGFVIAGPAGVGKTRLAEEWLSRLPGRDVKLSRITATEAARTVPLGAVAHLIPASVDLSDPVRGFAAVSAVFAGRERAAQHLLFVDDVHLLDTASTVLLRQLMDAGLIRLVATLRTGTALSDAAQALTQGDAVRRVDLGTLDQEKVKLLLESVLGGTIGRRTLHELFTASQGNVLYLRELVLGGLAAGTLTTDGQVWQSEERLLARTPVLTELIAARLGIADPRARPALKLLALCGQLPFPDLEATTPLEDLERLAITSTHHDGRRAVVTLAHPLYAEVLRDELPPSRRRGLLLAQAERTEGHGLRRRDDALHIASWRLAATGTADPELLTRAAAVARHAHDYQQVVTLLDALPEGYDTSVGLMRGEALRELGQWERADDVLASVEADATDEFQAIAATISRAMNLLWTGDRAETALDVIAAARARTRNPLGRRLLHVNEGVIRVFSGEPSEGLHVLDLELSERIGEGVDVDAWLWGAMAKSIGMTAVGRVAEAVTWAEQAYAAHREVDEHALLSHPAASVPPLALALTEHARIGEALEVGQKGYDDLILTRTPGPQAWLALIIARAELLAGRVKSARRWYAESATTASARRQSKPQRLAFSGVAMCAALLGELNAADEAMARAEDYPAVEWFPGEDYLGDAWRRAARGDLKGARGLLLEAAGLARFTGHGPSEAWLLTDVARLGGAGDVTARLGEITKLSEGRLVALRTEYVRALASQDPDLLLRAAKELGQAGLRLFASEAATTAASLWSGSGRSRQAAGAAQQARYHAASCEGARTPVLTLAESASTLTPREQEVALLAAGGRAGRDIAQALHISVRTVNNHLQNAYAKLGISNRQELASVLGIAVSRGSVE